MNAVQLEQKLESAVQELRELNVRKASLERSLTEKLEPLAAAQQRLMIRKQRPAREQVCAPIDAHRPYVRTFGSQRERAALLRRNGVCQVAPTSCPLVAARSPTYLALWAFRCETRQSLRWRRRWL